MAGAFSSAFSSAFDVGASDAIACTDQTAGRIYQRVAGGTTKTITFSGTYTGTTPSSVEVRIVAQSGGATVQDYTALSSATISGGNWSGSLSVPEGGWYNFLARSKNGGGTVLATSSQTSNKWGVGVLIGLTGQSNMVQMTSVSDTPPSSSDLTRQYTTSWAVVAGNGAIRFANQVQATLNLPVGILPRADSGTSIDEWATGSAYNAFATALTAVGGDCEFILWHQGEADMQSGTSYATYKASLDTLYARFRTSTGRSTSTLKFGCAIVGTLDTSLTSTDATSSAIRSAQLDWIGATTGAFYAGSSVDMARVDVAHWAAASYERMGRRYAQAILNQLGLVSFGADGPRITSAARAFGSAIIRLTVSHDAGTALEEVDGSTDGGSLTGFAVSSDDFATTLTISSTAFVGNEIQLTLSSAPAAGEKVHYQYGEDPAITNPVYDDTVPQSDSIGLPLQPTASALTVDESPSSSPSSSASSTPSATPSASASSSPSASPSPSSSPSASASATPSATPSSSPSASPSASASATPSASPSTSPSSSPSPSASVSASPSTSPSGIGATITIEGNVLAMLHGEVNVDSNRLIQFQMTNTDNVVFDFPETQVT